ncbi:hypothetical protein [Planctomicrobium sp. SH527]|uniref:hypothetical protein n=1 Tax=Planctomicrobium sp. SH527 TaxID=3448123 RepID=UPI003F5B3A64
MRVVDVKRYVWRSQKRNGALAQLVYELTRDPHWTLQAVGRDCSSIQMKIDRPRIGILVDSVDHAFHLAKKLPEASVSVGTPINTAAWAAPLKAWAEDYAKSTAPLRDTVITTHAGMSAIGRVNILINATTAPAPPRLPDEQLCSANPEDELLLLDIQDTDGGLLTKHSQSRMELYKRMPVDTACAKAALLTFLRTREEWQDDEF